MADTSNFNFYAVIPDAEVRQAVRGRVLDFVGAMIYSNADDGRSVLVQANDVDVSMIDECFAEMLELFENGYPEWQCPVCNGQGETEKVKPCLRCAGDCEYHLVVPDFAFEINNEPWDQWLGRIRMHAPGLPDFSGDCDADGGVRPDSSALLGLIDGTSDLDSLRREVAALTGRGHKAAIYGKQEST